MDTNAQGCNMARNVADINNAQATETTPVVSISIDSVSSVHLVVKKRILPKGMGFGVRPGRSCDILFQIFGISYCRTLK